MVRRRALGWLVTLMALVTALAYLRDPPWLIDQTTGLREWESRPGEPRYRWSGGHASFFVRADAGTIDIPISTTFDATATNAARPMLVTVSVDDKMSTRLVLTDASWQRVRLTLPPPSTRRVRRIDIRTNVTRDDNHGVRIGEIQ